MPNQKLAILLVFISVLVGIAITYGIPKPIETNLEIDWVTTPREISQFELKVENNAFTKRSLLGQWNIVLFGYLHCPDICPTGLMQMSKLAKQLSDTTLEDKVQFIFVSIDPNRDSTEALKQYVQYFNSDFLGATGEHQALKKFTSELGVHYEIVDDNSEYSVAHSVHFSLIDSDGFYRGRIQPNFNSEELIKELKTNIKKGK